MTEQIALFAAIILPFWNLPLIARIIRRKSSNDISRLWAFGVWFCFVLMFPAALRSPDPVFKAFNITNMFLFSLVTLFVFAYHRRGE